MVSALGWFLSLKTFFWGGNGHYSAMPDKEKISFRLSWPTLLGICSRKGYRFIQFWGQVYFVSIFGVRR
jgi:hypothetical protein